MQIERLNNTHWEKVREIYIEGMRTGNATFETTCPPAEEMDKKFIKEPRLVAIINDTVAGWAALTRTSPRYVYRGVCEISIYIGEKFRASV